MRKKVLPLRGTVNLAYTDKTGQRRYIKIDENGVYYDELPTEAQKSVDFLIATGMHVFLVDEKESEKEKKEPEADVLSHLLSSAKKVEPDKNENDSNIIEESKSDSEEKSSLKDIEVIDTPTKKKGRKKKSK